MNQDHTTSDAQFRVKDISGPKFAKFLHEFIDRWLPVLSGVEWKVLTSMQRKADFLTFEIDGYWSVGLCCMMTRLNRKTVQKAVTKLREYHIVTHVNQTGKTPLITIDQSVDPPMSARRHRSKRALNIRQPGPTDGLGAGPLDGLPPGPTDGLGAGPLDGPGAVPPDGLGPGPKLTPPIERRRDRETETRFDDDDDGLSADLRELTRGFAEHGMLLDQKMARRLLVDARERYKEVTPRDLAFIARDLIPRVNRLKFVKHPVPYLVRAILECLSGPTLERIRKQCEAEKNRQAAADELAQHEAIRFLKDSVKWAEGGKQHDIEWLIDHEQEYQEHAQNGRLWAVRALELIKQHRTVQ